MALRRTEPQWKEFLTSAGITDDAACTTYAQAFVTNGLTETSIPQLDKETLTELGVTTIGHRLSILNLVKSSGTIPLSVATPVAKASVTAKLSELSPDMTHPQFRKFLQDWNVYKNITHLQPQQLTAHLYNACDDVVRNSLINTYPNFLQMTEEEALNALKSIVTQRVNPELHRKEFGDIIQGEHDSIKDFVVRLRSAAIECSFECYSCKIDLSETRIRDQFIRGLHDQTLQADILSKTKQLKTLDELIQHAESYEAALRDQEKFRGGAGNQESDVFAVQPHKKNKRFQKKSQGKACSGCGSHSHGGIGSNDRAEKCSAWGKDCGNCGRPNHFASVCRQSKNSRNTDDEIACVDWAPDDPSNDVERVLAVQQTADNESTLPQPRDDEVRATVRFGHSKALLPCIADVNVFPDSGAGICLGGTQHVEQFGMSLKNLIPCQKRVKVVGGTIIPCVGWVRAAITIQNVTTIQKLYISEGVDRIFLSKRACIDVHILPPNFPQPMKPHHDDSTIYLVTEESNKKEDSHTPSDTAGSSQQNINKSKPKQSATSRPHIPYSFVESSVPVLKKYIIDAFKDTAFSREPPFPAMNHRKGHIHLKADAIPYAVHTPIPVPHHFKETIKAMLDDHVARGIIKRVPIGTPVKWCAQMVITSRKDGRRRICVDYQRLNNQCLRETHHCAPPFQVASQVPPGKKKTVLDVVDSYHSVELDEESQLLTTFITEWGRYMYLRVPQGFVAAGDMFTSRFDDIIEDVDQKVKIIDDTLLYADRVEDSFWQTWDFLTLCSENGVVVNKEKFQFCQDEVEFAGLDITMDGIKPSKSILSAIENFPPPTDLKSARSWFGLVNQVSWAYAISPVMQPFRDLIKPNNKFYWDETLTDIFHKSKKELIEKVKEGVKSFQLGRRT